MGGLGAPLSVEKSITSLRRVIESFSPIQNGCLFGVESKEMLW